MEIESFNLMNQVKRVPEGYIPGTSTIYTDFISDPDVISKTEKLVNMTKKEVEILSYETHLAKIRENKKECIVLKKKLMKLIDCVHGKTFKLMKKIISLNKKEEIMTSEYFSKFAKSIYFLIKNMKKVLLNLETVGTFLKTNSPAWYKLKLVDSKLNLNEAKKNVEYYDSLYNCIKKDEIAKRFKYFLK